MRNSKSSSARAWYGGQAAPDRATLAAVEAGSTRQLYAHAEGSAVGERVEQVQALRQKLRDGAGFDAWPSERGLAAMVTAVVDYGSDLRERAVALEQLGRYAFGPEVGDAEKRNQLQAALAPEVVDPLAQARILGAIWNPNPGGLLDLTINFPTQMGQVLADRIDPAESPPLEVVGFSLDGVDREARRALVRTRTAAYERDGAIYMLLPLLDALKGWDPPENGSAAAKLTLWEMLFVHELTEMVLEETLELEPLPAHIVATTFERLLDDTLGMAVESYFQELERQEAQQAEESVGSLFAEPAPAADPLADLFEPAPDSPVPQTAQTADAEPQGNPEGKTVVVIDDTAMIRQLVGSAVVKLGHQFMEAADGKEGVTLIKTVHPDLVVLDLNMGEMSGLDTLRAVRGDADFRRMPIIVLTVESRQRIIREVLTWKIDDYLIKPVNMKKLQERLATHLGDG